MVEQALTFMREVNAAGIPDPVKRRATELLLDLAGVACAGSQTRMAAIAREHCATYLASGRAPAARLLLDGRPSSVLGAVWAGGATLDSYDAHDGHVLTKGHAGVVILPALLAIFDSELAHRRGAHFMTALVIGYEIATRAGIALHANVPQYHCSGAWNAIGVAAAACWTLGLDDAQTREALGIADYHAPRGLMMRGVDFPTMVKDGAGAGGFAGLQAALLARGGHTGAPAQIIDHPRIWEDLGQRWYVLEQYMKPYPVCRWAQPAIEAAVALQQQHAVSPTAIETIRVHTFLEATRLAHAAPETTEKAQYSLPFPLAARLVRGDLGPGRIDEQGLRDPAVLDLASRVELVCDEALDGQFPGRRLARVEFALRDGRKVTSAVCEPRGEAHCPLSSHEVQQKYERLADPVLGGRARELSEGIHQAWSEGSAPIDRVCDILLSAPIRS